MDSYPGDLLAGVFPLAFAVDAIQSTNNEDDQPKRSLFDRFLDAMASHLVDLTDESHSKKGPRKMSGTEAFTSLLRAGTEDYTGNSLATSSSNLNLDEDSSDEEDMSIDSNSSRRFRVGLTSPSMGGIGMGSVSRQRQLSPRHISESTAYAKSLKLDGFFQRARIVSISNRHGFPPSKDATGQSNFSLKLSQARSALAMNPTNANALRLKRVMDQHPIDGILPSGWLEKHAAALPSVLLVVTTFQIVDKDKQDEQDAFLEETIVGLRESMAIKRECSIRIVCLADTPDQPTTPAKVEEWISRIKRDTGTSNISMLQLPHDLEDAGGGALETPLQKLHTQVRDASWAYYQKQCRRVKRKLTLLGHDHQPTLLPLAVRYCFKIGVFYEFLLKHTKAQRYFSDAYSHLCTYYRLLIGKSLEWNPVQTTEIVNPQGDDGNIEISASDTDRSNHDLVGETAGVEVALADSDDDDDDDDSSVDDVHIPLDIRKIFTELDPPFDMAHQCRAVADWLNFKLVQGGLQSASYSSTPDGVLAASAQWRRHTNNFLRREGDAPEWNYWQYVAHQRCCMSQLVERYPVSAGLGDDVVMRCSPWRNYMAAAEAQLRLGHSCKDATAVPPKEAASLQGQFVGGLTAEGFQPSLKAEVERKHADIALDMLTRAISHFEREHKKESEGEDDEEGDEDDAVHRCGARLYYLAGGVLLGRNQHKEAIAYLEKAVKYAHGWKGLELVIRRMLIECYEKHLPSSGSKDAERSETIASMILDSYFNSKMSSRNLRRALNNFSSLSGGGDGMMKWHRTCMDESDSSLPFSFAITFPGATHATAGDVATASVMLRSNLDYAVHINSLTLLSMAGQVNVPSNALLAAQNANEGTDGGIIVQAQTSILLSTQLEVPKDLDLIATDEAGNGGEKEGTAGKGSFAKSARPRTAGVTSAAGARLIAENLFEDGPQDRNSQWSVRYLGGKPLRCDGICLVFYPVSIEKATAAGGATKINLIELTIEKQQPKTAANIKRTPFEGDNYLSSAWSRPSDLPLERGPRCLRVLGPMPQMVVTNLSDALTGGKTVEGTVNRILIKLQAGPHEICEDIKYTVKCSSMLLSLDGTTRHLNMEDYSEEKQNEECRIPSLVYNDNVSSVVEATDFGYFLPRGWKLLGQGRGTPAAVSPTVATLKSGEETYFYFDVYRPHHTLPPEEELDETGSKRSSDGGVVDLDQLCQTDFDVKITYKQSRPKAQQNRGGGGRRRRKPPPGAAATEASGDEAVNDELEVVSLDYTGTVIWTSPLSVDFDTVDATQKAPPSGSRHVSNAVGDEEKKEKKQDDFELSLVDGERVSTRCTLWANEMPNDIGIDVSRVWFKENDDEGKEDPDCEFRVVGDDGSSTLFAPTEKDVCQSLGKAKKMGVMLTVEAHMNQNKTPGSLTTSMGIVCVDWTPRPLTIPPEAKECLSIQAHGPLSLDNIHSTISFRGPPCYIESAPFGTCISIKPSTPRVGSPFELSYTIVNHTNIHQKVSITLDAHADVLVAGSTKGDLCLSPMATQVLSYTAVATKAGKVVLPAISMVSDRYKTWLVSEAAATELYVLP